MKFFGGGSLGLAILLAFGGHPGNPAEPDVTQAPAITEAPLEDESEQAAPPDSEKAQAEPPAAEEVIAQLPSGTSRVLAYRGKLLDYDGSQMTGNYLLHFKLHDSSRLQHVAWKESVYVPTRAGIYQIILGRQKELPPNFSSSAYRMTVQVPRGTGWILGKLKLPPAPKAASKCRAGAVSFYRVETGDTLTSIAEKLCGNNAHWMDLYLENYDRIQRGGDLVPGQVLIVPQIKD